MELKEFIRLVLKEKIKDIEEIVVESKGWFYKWTEGEVEILEKEDFYVTPTYIIRDPPPCHNGTNYIDENGRTVMKYE